MANVVKAE